MPVHQRGLGFRMLPLDILQSRLLANDVLAKSYDVLVVVGFRKIF